MLSSVLAPCKELRHLTAQTEAQENTLGVSEGLSNLSLEKKDAVAEFLRNNNLEVYISRIIEYG